MKRERENGVKGKKRKKKEQKGGIGTFIHD